MNRYKEIENIEALRTAVEAGGTLRHYAFQAIDFRPVMEEAMKCRYSDCIFLGGYGVDDMQECIDETCMIIPRFNDLPFRVFRSGLYNAASLYEGYRPGDPDSYKECYDSKVYEHYLEAGKQTGDIKETLVRILHDHSINDGIDDFLGAFEEKSVVGNWECVIFINDIGQIQCFGGRFTRFNAYGTNDGGAVKNNRSSILCRSTVRNRAVGSIIDIALTTQYHFQGVHIIIDTLGSQRAGHIADRSGIAVCTAGGCIFQNRRKPFPGSAIGGVLFQPR